MVSKVVVDAVSATLQKICCAFKAVVVVVRPQTRGHWIRLGYATICFLCTDIAVVPHAREKTSGSGIRLRRVTAVPPTSSTKHSSSITGDHSKQDQILLGTKGKYRVFPVYRRSYLLWPPVIVENHTATIALLLHHAILHAYVRTVLV